MTILDSYKTLLAQGDIEDDAQQRVIIAVFDKLISKLQQQPLSRSRKWWSWKKPATSSVRGIYLFGSVGTGKTFLMDLFYQSLLDYKKARLHYHHFMQQVDVALRRLQGVSDPLREIARQLATKVRVLCLDEFLVHDVAQAMILTELLTAIFQEGIILVTTSNTPPKDLYQNGVQRERFLPAIALLESHCQILSVQEVRDYRLEKQQYLETYFYPATPEHEEAFTRQFENLEPQAEKNGTLHVQGRLISFIQCHGKTVWFDFQMLCNIPRSQLDYLELAERFTTFFISNVPKLDTASSILTVLFIQLVDVLYDQGIRLIIYADVPLDALYIQGPMESEFKRTYSRLKEMQSLEYRRRHPGQTSCHLLPWTVSTSA